MIKAGTATSLDADASPTVSASTNGITTTFNFGIPKGDTSDIKTPVFTDTVSTYTTLNDANTAAETTSNAIKSNVSIFTTLTNIKRSFSAIVQELKILATNVGAIDGITSDINSESDTIAASSKMVHDLNSSLGVYSNFLSHYTSQNNFYVNPNVGAVQKYNDICMMSFEVYGRVNSAINANTNTLIGNIDLHPVLRVTFPVSIMQGGNYVVSGIIFIDTNGNMYVNTNKAFTGYANIYGIAIFKIA